jgi:uncharacterized protein YigE (DUF2233 family)
MPKLRIFAILVAMLCGSVSTAAAACRDLMHLNASYTVCDFDPARADIRVYNQDLAGKAYGSFAALTTALWRQHRFVDFAMNGGMYQDDLSPVGLFVEEGIERRPISTAAGWGNFRLLPNGVFFIAAGKAGVMATGTYLKTGIKPRFATQSGPMLVIDGKIHPKFLPDSDSFKLRNGVGVDRHGRVYFVLSNAPVRFHDFATLFRDPLGCPNALFLDGSISSAHIPERGRMDSWFPLGPIIAVVDSVPF